MEPVLILYALFAVSIVLVVILIRRPAITATRGGKMLAFVTLFALPLACLAWGSVQHLEHSKQTQFCLSCHIMEPYGKSLYTDDAGVLAASHFQNGRVPKETACYSCHTDYVMYGDLRAKLRGLRHVYAQYIGSPHKPLRLYSAYHNRECLHCHAGARSFEESPTHAALREDLVSNQMSCLTAGCHSVAHDVANLEGKKFWRPQP